MWSVYICLLCTLTCYSEYVFFNMHPYASSEYGGETITLHGMFEVGSLCNTTDTQCIVVKIGNSSVNVLDYNSSQITFTSPPKDSIGPHSVELSTDGGTTKVNGIQPLYYHFGASVVLRVTIQGVLYDFNYNNELQKSVSYVCTLPPHQSTVTMHIVNYHNESSSLFVQHDPTSGHWVAIPIPDRHTVVTFKVQYDSMYQVEKMYHMILYREMSSDSSLSDLYIPHCSISEFNSSRYNYTCSISFSHHRNSGIHPSVTTNSTRAHYDIDVDYNTQVVSAIVYAEDMTSLVYYVQYSIVEYPQHSVYAINTYPPCDVVINVTNGVYNYSCTTSSPTLIVVPQPTDEWWRDMGYVVWDQISMYAHASKDGLRNQPIQLNCGYNTLEIHNRVGYTNTSHAVYSLNITRRCDILALETTSYSPQYSIYVATVEAPTFSCMFVVDTVTSGSSVCVIPSVMSVAPLITHVSIVVAFNQNIPNGVSYNETVTLEPSQNTITENITIQFSSNNSLFNITHQLILVTSEIDDIVLAGCVLQQEFVGHTTSYNCTVDYNADYTNSLVYISSPVPPTATIAPYLYVSDQYAATTSIIMTLSTSSQNFYIYISHQCTLTDPPRELLERWVCVPEYYPTLQNYTCYTDTPLVNESSVDGIIYAYNTTRLLEGWNSVQLIMTSAVTPTCGSEWIFHVFLRPSVELLNFTLSDCNEISAWATVVCNHTSTDWSPPTPTWVASKHTDVVVSGLTEPLQSGYNDVYIVSTENLTYHQSIYHLRLLLDQTFLTSVQNPFGVTIPHSYNMVSFIACECVYGQNVDLFLNYSYLGSQYTLATTFTPRWGYNNVFRVDSLDVDVLLTYTSNVVYDHGYIASEVILSVCIGFIDFHNPTDAFYNLSDVVLMEDEVLSELSTESASRVFVCGWDMQQISFCTTDQSDLVSVIALLALWYNTSLQSGITQNNTIQVYNCNERKNQYSYSLTKCRSIYNETNVDATSQDTDFQCSGWGCPFESVLDYMGIPGYLSLVLIFGCTLRPCCALGCCCCKKHEKQDPRFSVGRLRYLD